MKLRIWCRRHKRSHSAHAALHCRKKLPMKHGVCVGVPGVRRCTVYP